MNQESFDELKTRATQMLEDKTPDIIRKLDAEAVIRAEIQKMRGEGKALTLSDEEISMLESFRRFKLRMRRNGEVFTWQTRKPEGVAIVENTAEIVHPSEVSQAK